MAWQEIPVVYVAGPYRAMSESCPGQPDNFGIAQNIRRAERLALEVWRLGAAAICPHLNTANFQGAAPDDIWLEGDKALLNRCDAVLMTPDWERSSGAREEKSLADSIAIPVFFDIPALEAWVKVRRA